MPQPISIIDTSRQANEASGYKISDLPTDGLFTGAESYKDPSTLDTVKAAFATENSVPALLDRVSENDTWFYAEPKIDAKSRIDNDPLLKERVDRLGPEYRAKLETAKTEGQLQTMLLNGESRMKYSQTLQNSSGTSAIASMIVAGLLDPVDIAVAASTGGAGGLIMKGRKVGRAGKVLVTSTSAGAGNAAVEASLGASDPTRGNSGDVLSAYVAGAMLGAPFGFIGKADNARIEKAGRKAVGAPPRPSTSGFDMERYLSRTRGAESSGRPNERASTSSATGLYQFTNGTWLRYYKRLNPSTGESDAAILAKRSDPRLQEQLMRELTKDNISMLRANGLEVNDTSVYLMHFLGPGDAVRVLKAGRDAPLAKLVDGKSIKANPTIFSKYQTVGQLIDWAGGKMSGQGVSVGGGYGAYVSPSRGYADRMAAEGAAIEEARIERLKNNPDDIGGQGIKSVSLFPEDSISTPGSASSAAVTPEDVEYFGTKFLLPGSYAKLLDTAVPAPIRSFASKLISGPSRADDGVRAIAAENTASRLSREWQAKTYLAYNPHFNEWASERGYGLLRRDLTSAPQQEFMREVSRAIRGDDTVSAQAKAAGNAMSKTLAEILEDAKRAGIPGLEDVPTNGRYLPREISAKKFMTVRREIGDNGIRALLKESMVRGGMPEDLADRVSRAYAEGSLDRILGKRTAALTGLSEDSIERLRYYLPADDPELVDDVIAHLKQFRAEGNPDSGRIKNARHRVQMDELAKLEVNGKVYSIGDLFEDDAWQLFTRYTRTMGGWIGLSERAGIRSEADWSATMDALRRGAADDPNTRLNVDRLDEIKKLILGQPIGQENGTLRRAAQALSKANFVTDMGQAGMASIAEIGNAVAYAGLKNVMMHVPALRAVWKQARGGKLDEEFTDELRGLFGVGMRTKLSRGRAGFDEYADPLESELFDTVDRILDPMARGVSYVGLLGPVNDYLQLLSAKAFTQKFANVATGKKAFKPADLARLRDAGLEEGVMERALESIRKFGKFDGDRLVGLGAEKWDRQILADFTDAVDRMVYRAVQENDIGSSAWWMHTTTGKILTQFRGFVLNAFVKQTLYAARFRDMQAFTAFALTMTVGSMSYISRTYMNLLGEDEEKLKERLSYPRVVAAAFNSTGYSSILPSMIDTTLVLTGGVAIPGTDLEIDGPLFQHGRTTGLGSDFLTGNPSVQKLQNVAATATLPVRLMHDDYSFSQDDAKKMSRLLPFNNVYGVRNIIASMNDGLPEHSQEDEYWQ